MKKLRIILAAGSMVLFSGAGHAGIVPILSAALELIRAIPSASPPVAGANAAVSLNGGPSIGELSQSFSGLGSAAASVNIDRFRETSAVATASWEYVFRVAQPGITDIILNYTYSTSESVYTNFNANSRTTSSVSGLEAFLNVAQFEQHLTWPDLAASGNCSSSGFFDDCGPSPKAFARSLDKTFHYDSGYPVGTQIRILGFLLADAFGHTGIGSAESYANSAASFSIQAVPLPGTLPLSLLALGCLVAMGRRQGGRAAAGAGPDSGPSGACA